MVVDWIKVVCFLDCWFDLCYVGLVLVDGVCELLCGIVVLCIGIGKIFNKIGNGVVVLCNV